MAKAIMASAIVFEVLNKDNYVDWSETIEAYLKAQGLWDVIHSHFQPLQSEKEEEEEAWERKNAAALHAIKISCGRENLAVIRGIYQAKEAWLALEAKFNQHLPTTMVSAYKNNPFYDIKADLVRLLDEETAVSDEYKGAYNCLRDDFSRRNWYGIKNYCRAFPSLLKEKISNSRNVPILHELIVFAGRDREHEVVKMLESDQFPREALEMRNSSGGTALTVAAGLGSIVIAKCIVGMNPKLLFIPNDFGLIPLAVSIALHLNDMADYLYFATPPEVWSHENGKYGATLITKSLEVGNWEIALKLLEYYPNLTLAKDINGKSPVYAAACVPSLFCSSFHHRFLPKWICNLLGQWITLDSMDLKISGINLFVLIQKAVRAANDDQMKSGLVYDAFFEAIERGNFNFIVMLRYAKREILEELNDMSRNIYMSAIEHRQGNVFSLIFDEKEDDEIKLSVNVWKDKLNNNLLHMAATLAPPTALDCISGPALQFQRELQWFKEIEKLVPPSALTSQNADGMTPRELFTKNHKDMVVAGEKWMKDTASACAIVGPLIITIMFAAAFQLPGGNEEGNEEEKGFPIFKERQLFKIYMVSVAISLFSATSSVLMFLKLLTSNYTEEKFLHSLPNKMIIGLSTLFLSLATMIIAFCSGLALSLQEDSRILLPVMLLAVFPVGFFVWTQFPLLVEIFTSTYWPTSILDRKITNMTIPIIRNLYEDKKV